MNPTRTLLPILTLTILLALAAPAWAGSADDPEVRGEEGVAEEDSGLLVGTIIDEEDFSDVDLRAAWVEEENREVFRIVVQSAGDVTEETSVQVNFTIEAGPDSVADSTADGTRYGATATGPSLDAGPTGAGVEQDGVLTVFTFTRASVGASGGDLLVELVIEAQRTAEGGIPLTDEDDQWARDVAPREGTSRPYPFDRDPVVPGAALRVQGGEVRETPPDGGSPATRTFTGTAAQTQDADARIVFNVVVENTGTDAETFTLDVTNRASLNQAGLVVTLDEVELDLAPAATRTVPLTVELSGHQPQTFAIQLAVESARGASASASATVTIQAVGAPPTTPPPTTQPPPTTPPPDTDDERNPVLAVGPLTTAAEAMGLDRAFGDWAEVWLLAILLLLLLLLLFLLLFFGRRGWVVLHVSPKRLEAAPGRHAEFDVSIRNRRKDALQARMHFEGEDPEWRTGLLLTQDEGATLDPLTDEEQELEFSMNARDDAGSFYKGTLRVKVPADAEEGATTRVRVSAVPLDAYGEEKHRKARQARVQVAAGAAEPEPEPVHEVPQVRLSGVEHDPVDPQPGETVTTTATLENDDSERTWVLRAVLQVDGQEVHEQVVAVPPHKARAVVFEWQADKEEHHVRVQVFRKERDRP